MKFRYGWWIDLDFELPFAGDIEASGGEAPTSEVATFKRVGTTVGHDRVPSLEVTIPSYIPHSQFWRNLATEGKAGNPVNVSPITTKERLLATSGAGNTAAISAAGAVTLSPTVVATPGHSIDWRSDLYGVGLGIKYTGAVYTVDTISAMGVLTVDPSPTTAVAAAVYTVVGPSLADRADPGAHRGIGAILNARRGCVEQERYDSASRSATRLESECLSQMAGPVSLTSFGKSSRRAVS